MVYRYGVLMVSVLAALGLSACDKGLPGNGTAAVGSGNQPGEAAAQKRKMYTEAYNDLIDPQAGLRDFATGYRELNIPQADPKRDIYFPASTHLTLATSKLKEARALPGDETTAAADAAAAPLIAKLEALFGQAETLDTYYKTRAYREDALAKGKAADAPLLKAMDEVEQALVAFDAALREQEQVAATARIAALRKAGYDGHAAMVEMMQKGDRFTSAVIANDIAAADRMLPEFEAAVTALSKATPKGPTAASDKAGFAILAGDGASMIGAWRDYKSRKDESDRQRVVDSYNSAVTAAGMTTIPAT
ncbi:DUF3829 domain-containing protein [Sphingomonas arantia]|uniref:DUF3829 domain-containing protein n=1 Tax=Sphingomonas arantia TaxID=1460676 RepID=A0ABW4TX90_9SPHN